MASQPLQSLNQFAQQPVVGSLAYGIAPGVIALQAVVSVNQASALVPGQAVKFDAAITSVPSGLVSVIAAAQTDHADAYVLYDVKAGGNLVAGTTIQIVFNGFVWMLCESTVTVGQVVEDGADAGSIEALGTTSGAFPRGISMGYGTVGQLVICNLMPAVTKVSGAAA